MTVFSFNDLLPTVLHDNTLGMVINALSGKIISMTIINWSFFNNSANAICIDVLSNGNCQFGTCLEENNLTCTVFNTFGKSLSGKYQIIVDAIDKVLVLIAILIYFSSSRIVLVGNINSKPFGNFLHLFAIFQNAFAVRRPELERDVSV